MSGVFAEWQPRYAEHGVATFPVENKIPCVRHWQKVGLRGSTQLALKFADANAFGFQCGKHSGITLVDIDSRDKCMVGEAIKLFGESPIIWRTGSGNHAIPFRFNGEKRRIRAVPGLPIDLLGSGFAVAPPSIGAVGRYEFLQGNLADLDRLPVARSPNRDDAVITARDQRRGIPEGQRGDTLFKHALQHAPHVDDLDGLIDVVRTRNMDGLPPLSDAEVLRIAASAWNYEKEGKNLVGRGRAIVAAHTLIDGLMQKDPDAFLLLMMLKRHHWGRDFVVANAMAPSMPGGGWTLRRLQDARKTLVEEGYVELVRPGGFRSPATYRLCNEGVSVNAYQ
jgi:hypothetical protein